MEVIDQACKSLEELRAADFDRYAFIQVLIEKMRTQHREKVAIEEELKDVRHSILGYKLELEKKESKLLQLEGQVSESPFVLVLIDGDAAPFQDEFIQQGTIGGDNLAQKLRQKVIDYISRTHKHIQNYEIMIRVYAKIQYLDRTYDRAGILPQAVTLQDFVRGFNRVDALCEYVDAGNDSQSADNKVKGVLDLFVNNAHCQHIFICGLSDKGYIYPLRKCASETNRVTLIKSIPFPQELFDMTSKFTVIEFLEVFRAARIEVRASVAEQKTNSSHIIPGLSYASTASKCSAELSERSEDSQVDVTRLQRVSASSKLPSIQVDGANRRVDAKLPIYDKELVWSMKSRGLCHRHYLSSCSGICDYSHDAKLSPAERTALAHLARWTPCSEGVFCLDPDCVKAHVCIYGAKCERSTTRCRYPEAMHHPNQGPYRNVPARSKLESM